MAKKSRNKKFSSEEKKAIKLKNEHQNFARSLFRNAGFNRLTSAAGYEFSYKGLTSDFDDLFISENVLVICEYTTHSESNIANHLRKKSFVYKSINEDPEAFVDFIKSTFSSELTLFSPKYANVHYQVRIVYASRYNVRSDTKNVVEGIIYLDYAVLRYFTNISSTVKLSSKYELLDFLGVEPRQFADAAVAIVAAAGGTYDGSILPETYSNFAKGYKVVSFYVDAAALLTRAYVLRKNSWRLGSEVYQRMISPQKVESIRRYLLNNNVSFVNNIIVTLPPDTKLIDDSGDTLDPSKITKTTPGIIQLPLKFNSVGLIDGQHRVFSYYEGGSNEDKIAILRARQNLLVTGIMYPPDLNEPERTRVAARLFLEINSNQTNAKTDLKQEINLILKPFDADSIAKQVLNGLNSKGPLEDTFERHFFDKHKLKTTTVVSYGLRPLVRLGDEAPLFSCWANEDKSKVLNGKDDAQLSEYINFCVHELNLFIAGARANIGKTRWTTSPQEAHKVLNTTFVNGLVSCFRRVVLANALGSFKSYEAAFKDLDKFEFSAFKSSQYHKMGEKMFIKFFSPNS